jgi:hypothetical protein
MDVLRERFKYVEVVLGDSAAHADVTPGDGWIAMERAGRRIAFVVSHADHDFAGGMLAARFPGATHVAVRDATLREIFIALAKHASSSPAQEVAA